MYTSNSPAVKPSVWGGVRLMSRPVFHSAFADEINQYLDYKIASGFSEKSFSIILKSFDDFCSRRGNGSISFTRPDADEWAKKRKEEATTSHYARVNKVKNFLEYLSLKGYDVYLMHDVFFKATDFQPHIYTDDEISRYFHAVDTYHSDRHRMDAVQLPVLFRLLYCCGTRIHETLGIKKSDVDLENGIIKLIETKNDCERYIVLNDGMKHLMRCYADKTFYLIGNGDYIFLSQAGERRRGRRIYDIHRMILKRAKIPFLGDGKGPRLHDWRHTFAVRSFKQMVDSGLDMYVALPVLSTYLGHKTIYATERYVRLTMSLYPYIEERFGQRFSDIFGKEAAYGQTD